MKKKRPLKKLLISWERNYVEIETLDGKKIEGILIDFTPSLDLLIRDEKMGQSIIVRGSSIKTIKGYNYNI